MVFKKGNTYKIDVRFPANLSGNTSNPSDEQSGVNRQYSDSPADANALACAASPYHRQLCIIDGKAHVTQVLYVAVACRVHVAAKLEVCEGALGVQDHGHGGLACGYCIQ